MAQTLGSVAVGTVVKINENGSPVEFYVAKHDYESGLNGAGRTLLVRKDVYDQQRWNSTFSNTFASCSIRSWLNSTYKGLLDTDIQEAMGTTTYRYTPGNGSWNVSTRSDAVFLLSGTELGYSFSNWFNAEGSALPIVSTLRIAYQNGAATTQWTRSPSILDTTNAIYLDVLGDVDGHACTGIYGSRPVFTLPSTAFVLDDGTVITAPSAPSTLTVPLIAMQGNQITVSWTAVDGADGYILERKANTDSDWTQVYSGANTSFEETVGTWTSVQYRVKAGVSGTYGDYTTSASVPVVSASAVVISGTDGDLGTLVNDVSYTVSSDGSTELTVVETINGTETRTFTATNGATNKIPVVDLPTGYGTISITASTNPGSGVVSVTRNWTYSKEAITFPDAGGVADLIQNGQTIWAKTIAEAVRTPSIWGGNLGLALQKLMGAVLYNPTQVAKYSEVTVNLANVSVGQEVNLPYNGTMVPHIVVHIGNPSASLYDASCDGVWLLRKDIVENGAWNSSGVNTLPNSTIMQTMAGYVSNYASDVQAAIKTVKIPYCVGNGSSTVNSGANGLECKVFPLGFYEIGFTQSDASDSTIDGSKLDYFDLGDDTTANQKRAAMLDGVPSYYWTRSARTVNNAGVFLVLPIGDYNGNNANTTSGIRPAFIMPTTFTATYYVGTDGSVHASQEYEEAGTFTDISGGAIPMVQIETGSYVGTGTYGADNPNTLTFPFEPKMVIIQRYYGTGDSVVNTHAIETVILGTGRVYVRYVSSPGNAAPSINVTEFSKTVSWYSNSVNAQMNSGRTYQYIAIGLPGGAS